MAKRILLFLAVNMLVMAMVSIIMAVFGVQPYLTRAGINYQALMLICLIWGMSISFLSLAMSKFMAKWMMGVNIISPQTSDPDGQRLHETVSRLAKSAGIPTPEVGIYDSEDVNAFATGRSKRSSLVAVSTGLLHSMNQNELEGVLAHEVAHIANGDMVTMALLQGVINAFVMFLARAVAFAIMAAMGDDDENPIAGFGSMIAYYLIVFVLEMVFMLLGSLVFNAFSRWREFHADAGGAKYGGRENMIAALRKLQHQEILEDPNPAYRSMCINSKKSWMFLFSTHPPLEDRIKRLETMRV